MAGAKSSSLDMTKGNPFKLIVAFSLPLLAGNALQQLYNMVDSMVVGRFVGETALAAVGATFPFSFLMSSLFMGMGSGAMVMVSQYYGAGKGNELRKTIDTIYASLTIGIIPLSLLGVLLTGPALTLLNVQPDVWGEAYIYLVIVMGGLIGSLGYNANAGILQGLGDSKTPLLLLAVACGMNIVLDLLFVLVIPLGVAGVAVATITAQISSWIFGIFVINKKYPALRIRIFPLRFDKATFKQILRLGLPAGIQQAMFSFGVIMMNRLVNGFGSVFTAGYNAAGKLDAFAFLPIQSVSTAIIAYTGQNIGAQRMDRVKAGTRATMLLSLGFSALGLLVIPAGPTLMRLFTDSPQIIAAGMSYITRIMPFYWMLGILFVLNSVMRGAGDAIIPMISSIVSLWLARVPAAYLLADWFGRDNLSFAFAAGWLIGLAITVPFYFMGKWKRKGFGRAGENRDNAAQEATV